MAVGNVVYENVPQKEKNAGLPELPIQKLPQGWGARHTQALLLFLSLSVGYSMRAQLSVSLVAMTSNSTLLMWYPDISIGCFYPDSHNISENNDTYREGPIYSDESEQDTVCRKMKEDFGGWTIYRIYKWDEATQEMILFSFFLGYTCMMIPMGLLAQKYGGKITLMFALGTNALLSIITPWLPIFAGWLGVCICRFLQGLTQSAFYPSIHTMLGKWAPLSERGRLGALIYTGSQFGTVVAFQVAGFFSGSPALGWPVSFWFCGIFSMTCFALLAWLGAASPHEHPSISSEEFVYIVGDTNADSKSKDRRTPWKYILSSPAIWGIIAAHAGSAFEYLIILTQIPLYMSNVLNVDIKNNGLFSSLPYISMYFTSIAFGYVTDWIISKKLMTVVNIRRWSNTIGMIVSGLFLVAFGYVQNTEVAVILLVMTLSSHSGVHTGFHINSIDLAPNFAGPIMAVGNMLANLSSLTIPLLVTNIVGDDTKNQYKWQILFLTVAAVQILTNTLYVVFARGTVQKWNFHESRGDSKTKANDKLENSSAEFFSLNLKQ